ncbi:alpha/beta hydrolase family protein [Simiduia agarivorans]|uniref:Prolyl oligopeptidase family protein n=1 Tax=Simiduia agarivorans (strain DSM 21679 / JCM 13881 / BCRC 17597 / SA1) TaxID=1117647 RepID=K4KQ45_SIMAS|nr:prolyl oligopeptidase family serine peptidase [Simiduia agarivorans]AFV00391.1 prolyl oligopeptidase family protein [Simiduia agarivorans SA1 = DSM 21679]
MQSLPIVGLWLLALLFLASAQAAPTIEQYGALANTQKMALSPSGKFLAFRSLANDKDRLIVYSLEQNKALLATDISKLMPHQIYFADDEHVILVMSQLKRFFGYRGEYNVSTAFVVNVSDASAQQLLTPGDNIAYAQTGLGRVVGISADKKTLYMPALVGRTEDDLAPDLSLMKVNIDKPRRPRRAAKGKNGTNDFFLNDKGKIIARETYNNAQNRHQIEVKDGASWKAVFQQEAEMMQVSFVASTPDFASLVMLHIDPESGRDTYSTLELATGNITPKVLTNDSADVERVFTNVNRTAFGVQYSGLKPSYKFFDPAIDQQLNTIVNAFPQDSVWLTSWSDDWKKLLVYVEGDTTSGDYYLFSQGEKPRYIASARSEITPDDLHPTGRITLAMTDGMKVPTILTIPQDKAQALKNLPAVVLPHGGPESYDRTEFDWLAQAIASQGYLVIKPQFRGSAGYGRDHLVAGFGEWGRKMQDDVTESLQKLVAKGIVDGDRVCIVGGSYGGYSALAGGAFTPDVYRCVVSFNGVSNLPDMLKFERKRYGKHHWVITYFEQFMVPGEATKEKLNAVSPSEFAAQFKAPVLLIHGENDETVPFDQSELMYEELKDHKKSVQLIKLKDENHHLMNQDNRQLALRSIIDFLNEHLQPKQITTR